MRKNYDATFKTKVALEAIKEHSTIGELVSKFEINRVQIHNWKKIALQGLTSIFTSEKKKFEDDKQLLIDDLYREIGKLKMEINWLKKKFRSFS